MSSFCSATKRSNDEETDDDGNDAEDETDEEASLLIGGVGVEEVGRDSERVGGESSEMGTELVSVSWTSSETVAVSGGASVARSAEGSSEGTGTGSVTTC